MGKYIFVIAGILVVLIASTDCIKKGAQHSNMQTGTVKYIGLEGGFYGIYGDDSLHYDPINLPKEFQKDSLRIRFEAKIRSDLASYHMWGKIIELKKIEKLKK